MIALRPTQRIGKSRQGTGVAQIAVDAAGDVDHMTRKQNRTLMDWNTIDLRHEVHGFFRVCGGVIGGIPVEGRDAASPFEFI